MSRTMTLLKETYTLDLGVVSRGVDACVRRFCEELPFRVHEFKSGSQCWGWTVPMDWSVQKATIVKDGLVVYDGTTHPLGVWGYSRSFQGTLGVEELRRHLAYSEDWEDALVYHGALYYRPHIEDWGFSVPRSLFGALEEGEYQVDLRTELKPGTLKVLDFVLPGTSPETVVLNAHNCHAAQANDDMSGCVVGVEVMRRLQARSNYYTYRLLICPELYGVIFFLNNLSPEERAVLKYGIMLKSVGNVEPLSLQKSFTGDTDLDRAAVHVFSRLPRHGRIGAFRTVYGNDEIVFEAPGFEIPSVSLTRYPTSMPSAGRFPVPFREYHTSKRRRCLTSRQSTICPFAKCSNTCSAFERRA